MTTTPDPEETPIPETEPTPPPMASEARPALPYNVVGGAFAYGVSANGGADFYGKGQS